MLPTKLKIIHQFKTQPVFRNFGGIDAYSIPEWGIRSIHVSGWMPTAVQLLFVEAVFAQVIQTHILFICHVWLQRYPYFKDSKTIHSSGSPQLSGSMPANGFPPAGFSNSYHLYFLHISQEIRHFLACLILIPYRSVTCSCTGHLLFFGNNPCPFNSAGIPPHFYLDCCLAQIDRIFSALGAE